MPLTSRKRLLTVAGALTLGIAIVVLFVAVKGAPAREETGQAKQAVLTMEVTAMPFQLQAAGFGRAGPVASWQAVARVGGRVTWRHPDLESGVMIEAGTWLMQTDPSRYQLAVSAAEADTAVTQSELAQLNQEERNTQQLLSLERERLALAERELERARRLASQGAVSQTRLDEQERATLQQRQAARALQNQLDLIPAKRRNLQAHLDRTETALNQAKKDLEDTRFEAPYDLRVHSVEAELHQEVKPGQVLFVADSIATAEAVIQLPFADVRRLLRQIGGNEDQLDSALPDLNQKLDLHRVQAFLSLTGDPEVRWPARLSRIASGLDPSTRTVQAVLTVAEPYRGANPPQRPPLVRDMYVKGTLSVMLPEAAIVVPASAVHGDIAYVVNKDDRLEFRALRTAFSQRDMIVVTEGLQAGDRLVLDDLVPAVEGTPLAPRNDPEAQKTLRQRAGAAAR